MLERPRRRQHAARRQRRYRARQRQRELVVTVALCPEETAKLSKLRYLSEAELEDRAAIADAIHLLLAHILDV